MKDLKILTEFYEQFNNEEAKIALESTLDGSQSNEELWTANKKYFEAELKRLRELQDKIQKVSSLISQVKAVELSQSIDSMISHLSYASSFADNAMSDSSIDLSRYDQEVDHFHNDYKEFSEQVEDTYDKYYECLYNAARLGVISMDDLIEIRDDDKLNDDQKKAASEALEKIREEKEVKEQSEQTVESEMSEQADMRDEKGKSSNSDISTEDYSSSHNEEIKEEEEHAPYFAEQVTEKALEKELAALNEKVQEFQKIQQENGKLTLRQSVEFQALQTHILQLEEYAFKLSWRQERREEKISNLEGKIDTKERALDKTKENYAKAKSQLFKNLSAKKQGKLEEKLKVLNEKLGVIKEQQRMSSLVKFDKINKKIAKKAKVDAVTSMIKEKAVAAKDKTVSAAKEAGNIASDIGRYVRNNALMQKLKEAKIRMVGAPSELTIQSKDEEMVASM